MSKLLYGWKEVAEFLRLSENTVRGYKKELEAKEIIFRCLRGKPPNRRWGVCAWEGRLAKWYQTHTSTRKRRVSEIK